jgi:glutamine transport system substrate-binding protein
MQSSSEDHQDMTPQLSSEKRVQEVSPQGTTIGEQQVVATQSNVASSFPASQGISSSETSDSFNVDQKKGRVPFLMIIFLLIFSFLGGLFLAAWYFQTQLQKELIPSTVTRNVLVPTPQTMIVGTDATFQPMEYVNREGSLIGYDIDLGSHLANELGVKVEFKNIPWNTLFSALDKKEIDMIISAVTITEERKQLYSFSDAYLDVGQVIVTKKSDIAITSSVNLRGKKIGVQQNTTSEKEALLLTSSDLVFRYPDFAQTIQALLAGKVDALLSDFAGVKGIIDANPTLKIASDPITKEYYGIVFRKGDSQVSKINDVLTSLRTKGVLIDLRQKWLN